MTTKTGRYHNSINLYDGDPIADPKRFQGYRKICERCKNEIWENRGIYFRAKRGT